MLLAAVATSTSPVTLAELPADAAPRRPAVVVLPSTVFAALDVAAFTDAA